MTEKLIKIHVFDDKRVTISRPHWESELAVDFVDLQDEKFKHKVLSIFSELYKIVEDKCKHKERFGLK